MTVAVATEKAPRPMQTSGPAPPSKKAPVTKKKAPATTTPRKKSTSKAGGTSKKASAASKKSKAAAAAQAKADQKFLDELPDNMLEKATLPITAQEYDNLELLMKQFCRVPLLAEFSRPVKLLHPEVRLPKKKGILLVRDVPY